MLPTKPNPHHPQSQSLQVQEFPKGVNKIIFVQEIQGDRLKRYKT